MAYNTAARAYGNNRIETATPAELTLMLYEGAVSSAISQLWDLRRKTMGK